MIGEQSLSQRSGQNAHVLLVDFIHVGKETSFYKINADNLWVERQGSNNLTGKFDFKKTNALPNQAHWKDAFHSWNG